MNDFYFPSTWLVYVKQNKPNKMFGEKNAPIRHNKYSHLPVNVAKIALIHQDMDFIRSLKVGCGYFWYLAPRR